MLGSENRALHRLGNTASSVLSFSFLRKDFYKEFLGLVYNVMWVLEAKVFLSCQMVQDPCFISTANLLGYGYNN